MSGPAEKRDRLLDGARLRSGDDALDLSGWSSLTFGAHERIGDGWVYTIAADAARLEELLAAAHERDAPGIAYLVGDIEALPLPDASIDVAVGASAFAGAADVERAAAELRRVLRPDGRLSLCEPGGNGEVLAVALREVGFAGVSVEPGDGEAWVTAHKP